MVPGAILRHDTPSIVTVGNVSKLFPFADAASRNLSGRTIYAPSRNDRKQTSWNIRSVPTFSGGYGFACIGNPHNSMIENRTGEMNFAPGPQSMIRVLLIGLSGAESSFSNIDGVNVTYAARAAIEVVPASGAPLARIFHDGRVGGQG